MSDLDTGDRDAGDFCPTEVQAQAGTMWHPSFAPASLPKYDAVTPESFAKGHAALQEAKRMLAEKQRKDADIEAVRAAIWNGLPLAIRRGAVIGAGMARERADDTLNKFDAFERGAVFLALKRTMSLMEDACRCMQGGKVPAGRAVH